MEKIFTAVLNSLAHGGPEAIISILFAVVVYLVYDRIQLVKTAKTDSEKNHDDLMAVIEKYHTGQIDLIKAMHDIQLILVKLEAKS